MGLTAPPIIYNFVYFLKLIQPWVSSAGAVSVQILSHSGSVIHSADTV